MKTQLIGILNLTADSFSDGGRFLTRDAALAHAERLLRAGAAIIDVGAESSNPAGADVPVPTQIDRLRPVVQALVARGATVSVDTHRPEVMQAVLACGAQLINDITGFRDPASVAAVRETAARLIVMHAVHPPHSTAARAAALDTSADQLVARIREFFSERVATLTAAGIATQRLILDPGMGLFLGKDSAASVAVLRHLSLLCMSDVPLCVSTSRKSFIGALLADTGGTPRPVDQRGAGTLMTELWAVAAGVEFVRTHDVQALHDALRIAAALRGPAG